MKSILVVMKRRVVKEIKSILVVMKGGDSSGEGDEIDPRCDEGKSSGEEMKSIHVEMKGKVVKRR